MLKIGATVSNKGDKMMVGCVTEALSYNATALMFYLGAPQNTIRKDLEQQNYKEAIDLALANNIDLDSIIVHAPYVVNLANPDPEKRKFSIEFLTKELSTVADMGLHYMVLHPGCHVGEGSKTAINYISDGINQILSDKRTKDAVILLETMAGKGTEVGRTFEEIKSIIDKVNDKTRVKVCLDTCHINDAGYDLVNDYENVMRKLNETIGLQNIKAIHLNDSKNVVFAHKDRHENIGFGTIGFDTLCKVCYDERFKDIPKILETPYLDKTKPLFKEEIEMLRRKEFNSLLKNSIN